MRMIIFIVLLLASALLFAGNEDFIRMEIDSLHANESLCNERNHVNVSYYLVNEDVPPVIIDYPDSTVVYYYDNNTQIGVIFRCRRCGELVGEPSWQQPKRRVTWRRDEKENSDTADNPDSPASGKE